MQCKSEHYCPIALAQSRTFFCISDLHSSRRGFCTSVQLEGMRIQNSLTICAFRSCARTVEAEPRPLSFDPVNTAAISAAPSAADTDTQQRFRGRPKICRRRSRSEPSYLQSHGATFSTRSASSPSPWFYCWRLPLSPSSLRPEPPPTSPGAVRRATTSHSTARPTAPNHCNT